MLTFTTNNSWSSLPAARFDQIISNQLDRIKVDRTWFEALCDFLTHCFSCDSDSAITNAEIVHAAKGLIASQIRLNSIMDENPTRGMVDVRCHQAIKEAWVHAKKLADIGNSETNQYLIKLRPQNSSELNSAIASNSGIVIYISQKGHPEPLFLLVGAFQDQPNVPAFRMITMPDPRQTNNENAQNPQQATAWEANEQFCTVIQKYDLINNQAKTTFYEQTVKDKLFPNE